MAREEGHYTIKRVKKLPKKGNSNLLYVIKTEDTEPDVIEKCYRWLLNGTYQEITLGGSGSFPGFTDLPTDYGVILSTVAISNDYNDLDNLPITSGDNLGNHTATQDLIIDGFNLSAINSDIRFGSSTTSDKIFKVNNELRIYSPLSSTSKIRMQSFETGAFYSILDVNPTNFTLNTQDINGNRSVFLDLDLLTVPSRFQQYPDGDGIYALFATDGLTTVGSNSQGVLDLSSLNFGSGISNIAEDTTPQLGANLDLNTFQIESISPKETADILTVIPLDTSGGHNGNMNSANTEESYTILASPVLNGWAQVLINTANEPNITGAIQEGGIPWIANTNLYLIVRNKGLSGVVYYYLSQSITSTSSGTKFTQTVGDGVTNSIQVTHNKGTEDIIVQIVDLTTNKFSDTEITIDDTNNITLDFATIPTINQYKVIIL